MNGANAIQKIHVGATMIDIGNYDRYHPLPYEIINPDRTYQRKDFPKLAKIIADPNFRY